MRPLLTLALLVAVLIALAPTTATATDACGGGNCRVKRTRLVERERDGVKRERSVKRIWTRR